MKKLVLPIDGTKRSLQTISWVANNYKPEDVEVTIIMVADTVTELDLKQKYSSAAHYMITTLKRDAKLLEDAGFTVNFEALFGDPGKKVVEYTNKMKTDEIVMTKSTKDNWFDSIGSVTNYVVKYASCVVSIIPENK